MFHAAEPSNRENRDEGGENLEAKQVAARSSSNRGQGGAFLSRESFPSGSSRENSRRKH